MIRAACPSCGAPVVFRHATQPAAVCGRCGASLVRTDEAVRQIGRVTPMPRDLSPLQVGARGRWQDADFEVVGVLRKGRERVRWNEWFLLRGDGTTAWLGEGNGAYAIYDRRHEGVAPPFEELEPGQELVLPGGLFRVAEVARGRVLAGEGALPHAVEPGRPFPYADLRQVGGNGVATLDYEDGPGVLWIGQPVQLSQLDLVGLRPLEGWSDPGFTAFAGPAALPVRKLACPHCAGSLELHAPGAAQRLACRYCGSLLDLDEVDDRTVARVLEAMDRPPFQPTIEPGLKGTFEGAPWEVLGAMRRRIVNEWGVWEWTEYLLYNPFRGVRWLIEDSNGHWSFGTPLQELPDTSWMAAGRLVWRGRVFRHFQAGEPEVAAVLGEFTWQVRAGDRATTTDWVSPPWMLSRERTPREEVWTAGRYLPPEEVAAAFDQRVEPLPPQGVAPHQPNPWQGRERRQAAWRNAAILGGLAAVLWVLASILQPGATVQAWGFALTSNPTDVWVSPEVPLQEAMPLEIRLSSDVPRSRGLLHAGLIDLDHGVAYPGRKGVAGSGTIALGRLPPGTYVVQVLVAKPRIGGASGSAVHVELARAGPWRAPVLLLALIAVAGVGWVYARAHAFETARWRESDHA